jgi:methionyl-tRNA formyltransferase
MSKLSTIIFLTHRFYTKKLIELTNNKNTDISIIYVQHPNELLQFGHEFLKKSRLISFGSIFYVRQEILSLFEFDCYNFHPGPPNYPGWAPFSFAIYDEASTYGVTVHKMNSKIDTGNIIKYKKFNIPNEFNVENLMDITTSYMYELYNELILDFISNQKSLSCIDEKWCGKIRTKKDFEHMCHITLDLSEEELKKRINAFANGDGYNVPFIQIENNKYIYSASKEFDYNKNIIFHNFNFIKI